MRERNLFPRLRIPRVVPTATHPAINLPTFSARGDWHLLPCGSLVCLDLPDLPYQETQEVLVNTYISAVQRLRPLRGGAQSHLLEASDGTCYVHSRNITYCVIIR